ncbi:MAG: hypothetical protein R3331_09430 [Sulfurospirillaceae bacterium]|nr:hypothetical protein [Sulfurospirillaceae bacterium]
MERNLLLLVLLLSQFYGSDTFWFSYRSVTSNNALVYEQKNISPLVIPFPVPISAHGNSKCKVKVVTKPHMTSLNILNKNFDKILPCFYKSNVVITSHSTISTNGINDVVEIVIEPVRFIVDFKDDFANITILKKQKN